MAIRSKNNVRLLSKVIEDVLIPSYNQVVQQFLNIEGQIAIKEIAERTPVDYGNLRAGWNALPATKSGDKFVVKIVNPVEYAHYVEYGYLQTPGRILLMEERQGKLRFLAALGFAKRFRVGDPDKNNMKPRIPGKPFVIVTRDRFIKGRFMARHGIEATINGSQERFNKSISAMLNRISKAFR